VINDESFQTKDEIDLGESLDEFDASTMALFKDKIVIIGPPCPKNATTTTRHSDRRGGKQNFAMNGVEIHATAIQNVIDGSFVTRSDPTTEMLIVVLISLAAFLGFLALKKIHIRVAWLVEIGVVVVLLLLVGAVVEASILAFSNSGVMMNMVNPACDRVRIHRHHRLSVSRRTPAKGVDQGNVQPLPEPRRR